MRPGLMPGLMEDAFQDGGGDTVAEDLPPAAEVLVAREDLGGHLLGEDLVEAVGVEELLAGGLLEEGFEAEARLAVRRKQRRLLLSEAVDRALVGRATDPADARGSSAAVFAPQSTPGDAASGAPPPSLSICLEWTPLVARASLHSPQCRVHSLVCSVPERLDSSTVRTDTGTRLESACPVSVHPHETRAPGITRRDGIKVPGAPARTGALEPTGSLARISLRRVAQMEGLRRLGFVVTWPRWLAAQHRHVARGSGGAGGDVFGMACQPGPDGARIRAILESGRSRCRDSGVALAASAWDRRPPF